jgi:oligopeptidase A
MGHALHVITSKVKEISASGFNGTEWDVVEYPSQWLQEFANNKEVIKSFAKHYQSGEIIPDKLIDKMLESENYGQGMANNRQVEFGLFDLMIHDRGYSQDEVQEKLDEVRKMVGVLEVPKYNKFQHSFSHIFAGGYAAGYYSYKWAEVLSADTYLEMTKDGKINRELANNFFDNLLSLGG